MSADSCDTTVRIRPIGPQDNAVATSVIRRVMAEFGAVGCNWWMVREL